MPIITEQYSNPRWGFLEGLGQAAAAPTPRLLLRDPKTGAFSNQRFEALKQILIDAIQRARADYQKILDRSSGALKDSLLTQTKPRIERFDGEVRKFFNANYEGWDNTKAYDSVLAGIRQEISLLQGDAQVLQVQSDMSFYKALLNRAKVITNDLYEAGAGVVGPGVWLLKNLPWILGIGAVVIIAGPTIVGAITGGTKGAAEAAGADIQRARGAIASGARTAASAASKGLLGSPKRARRRSRSR